jgi:ABC-type Fe3+-hydroxamate transport system substrate-binding protein
MSISSDCFISSMMKEIGGINLFQEHEERYPHIEEIPSDLDALILSSEPFPFREKHRRLLSKRFAIPINKVYFIDGAYCSWHGAKMKEALPYLHQWRSRL